MNRIAFVLAGSALVTLPVLAARNVDEFKTSAGTLKITTVQHAGFIMEAGGQTVYVDPAQGSFDGLPPADLILLTDIHSLRLGG